MFTHYKIYMFYALITYAQSTTQYIGDKLLTPSAHISRLLNAQIDLIFGNLINGTLRYSNFEHVRWG